MLAYPFDVEQQVGRGILTSLACGGRTVTAALIKIDDAINGRVKITAVVFITARAGTAVQKDNRDTLGIATLLHIQPVHGSDL